MLGWGEGSKVDWLVIWIVVLVVESFWIDCAYIVVFFFR